MVVVLNIHRLCSLFCDDLISFHSDLVREPSKSICSSCNGIRAIEYLSVAYSK